MSYLHVYLHATLNFILRSWIILRIHSYNCYFHFYVSFGQTSRKILSEILLRLLCKQHLTSDFSRSQFKCFDVYTHMCITN